MAGSGKDGGPSGARRRDAETIDAPRPRDDDALGALSSLGRDSSQVSSHDPTNVDSEDTSAEPTKGSALRSKAQHIGRFIVLGVLGEGGMGTVLKAYDETLARMVAVKLLRQSLTDQRQERLLREAQALAQLSHPNVVQVYEMGVVEGMMFIAMELVTGQTLYEWQRGGRPWSQVLDKYLQAGRGLAAAHDQEIVHRDFKPENGIVGDDGRVRVLDFGLARGRRLSTEEPPARERAPAELGELDNSLERPLTRSGAVIGTLRYLPLQQLTGAQADTKSDQYSFCVSLYEALYGIRPFPDSSLSELISAQRRQQMLPTPRGILVPNRLRRVLLRGLSKEPADRWPSMEALLEALERVRRPHPALWGGLAAVALAGVGGLAWSAARPPEEPCKAPEAGLEGVWSPEDRGAVRAAFMGSGHPEAERLLAPVKTQLDAYVAQWVQMSDRACHATFVEHRQSEAMFDRRVLCLHRRRSRLRSAIDSLVEASTAQQVVDRMIVPFTLPPIEACADIDALMARQPLPATDEARAQVGRLREQIDQALTLRAAGEPSRGLELAEATVAEARTIDYLPVLAEALECLGRLQIDGASSRAAETTLDEAIEVAAQAKADDVAARSWSQLLYVLMAQDKFDEGLAVARAARAAVERAGDETSRGWMLNNLGVLHGQRSDFVRSLHFLRQAREVKAAALGDDHVEVGIAWFNLGNALMERGSADEAVEAFERAHAIFVGTLGELHPYMAFVLTGLGQIEQDRGEWAQAIEHHRRALVIYEAALGPDHFRIVRSLRYLAQAELGAGRLDQARTNLGRGWAMIERLYGPNDPEVAHARSVLASVELAQGRPREALPHAERAVELLGGRSVSDREWADAIFVLARSLEADPSAGERARRLAERARDVYAGAPNATRERRIEVSAWLMEHPPASTSVDATDDATPAATAASP